MTHTERKRILNSRGSDFLPKHFWGALIQKGVQDVGGAIMKGQENMNLVEGRQSQLKQNTVNGVAYDEIGMNDLNAKESQVNADIVGNFASGNVIGGIAGLFGASKRRRRIAAERANRNMLNQHNRSLAENTAFQNDINATDTYDSIIYAKNGLLPCHSFGWGDAGKMAAGLFLGGVQGLGAAVGSYVDSIPQRTAQKQADKQIADTRENAANIAKMDANSDVVWNTQMKDKFDAQLAANNEKIIHNNNNINEAFPLNKFAMGKVDAQHSRFVNTDMPVFTPMGAYKLGKANAHVNDGETMIDRGNGTPEDFHAAAVEGVTGKTDGDYGYVNSDTEIIGGAINPYTGNKLQDDAYAYTKQIEAIDKNMPKMSDKLNKLRGAHGRRTDDFASEYAGRLKQGPMQALNQLSAINHQVLNGTGVEDGMVHAKCGMLPRHAGGFDPSLMISTLGQLGGIIPQMVRSYTAALPEQNAFIDNPYRQQIATGLDRLKYDDTQVQRQLDQQYVNSMNAIRQSGGLNAGQKAAAGINAGIRFGSLRNDAALKGQQMRNALALQKYSTLGQLGEQYASHAQNARTQQFATYNAANSAKDNAINKGWANAAGIHANAVSDSKKDEYFNKMYGLYASDQKANKQSVGSDNSSSGATMLPKNLSPSSWSDKYLNEVQLKPLNLTPMFFPRAKQSNNTSFYNNRYGIY